MRQLRLRDIGGIIVIDFIDMVLESNRDLVLRRLVECLGRDRTKHQVAEVTSLGPGADDPQAGRQGLLEVFSETCEHCNGRGSHPDRARRPSPDDGRAVAAAGRGRRAGPAAVDRWPVAAGRPAPPPSGPTPGHDRRSGAAAAGHERAEPARRTCRARALPAAAG